MAPGYIALIFWVLSGFAIFGFVRSVRTGVARSTFTYRAHQNPLAFTMVLLGQVFVVALAIAETLYALGLIGDPIIALRAITPLHR